MSRRSGPLAGTRALVRLAVRDARRDRWRSLLVLTIVALPVAGLVGALTLADSVTATAQERADRQLGRADVALYPSEGTSPDTVDDDALLTALPPLPDAAEVAVQWQVRGTTVGDGRQLPFWVTDADLSSDALAAGRLELVDGRAPSSDNAIALSGALLEVLDLGIGDELVVEPLGELVVVGELRDPEELSREVAAVAPGRLAGLPGGEGHVLLGFPDGVVPDLGADVALPAVDASLGAQAQSLDDATAASQAFIGVTRAELESQRFGEPERWFFVVVGGLLVVEVALVAGAAFAVSVRRRQRELGLLAATGASRRQVRRNVLFTGATVGLVGATVGAVLGVLATWVGLPLASRLADRAVEGVRVDPGFVLGAVLVGMAASVAGAWWPARGVARLPILTALSGRRPASTGARSSLWTGLALAATGAVVCLVGAQTGSGDLTLVLFLGGCILVVLGAGLTSPWLLEQLGRTARFLPVGMRLAVRDAARFRGRNGPIVTAAMAGLAAAVTVATVVTSLEADATANYRPPVPDNTMLVRATDRPGAGELVGDAVDLDGAPLRDLAAAVIEPDSIQPTEDGVLTAAYVMAVVDDGRLAELLVGPAAAADLAAGRAVALHADTPDRVEVHADGPDGQAFAELVATFDVAVHALPGEDRFLELPGVLVPETAATLDLEVDGGLFERFVLVADGPIGADVVATARATAGGLGDVDVRAEDSLRTRWAPVRQAVTIGGAVFGLLIVGVAIALAAAEARADLRTLTAVGAGRRTRRSLAAGRALLLAGLGGILAVPVGVLPAAAILPVIGFDDEGYALVLPWTTLAIVAVGLPLVAAMVALVASRRDPGTVTRAA